VQQQQVERVGADALQRALGRHAEVARVRVGAAQRRVGEAREALRPLALAFVEVVPDRADEAERVALHALDRATEQPVRLALPVGVGGQDRVDPVPGLDQREEPLVIQRLAEVHEPPAAPGAEGGVTERDQRRRV
jgi:hypothetical protein